MKGKTKLRDLSETELGQKARGAAPAVHTGGLHLPRMSAW